MTSVIRYVKNNIDDVNLSSVNSTGSDYQLVAFDIVTTADIAVTDPVTSTVVLKWTGAGEIKAILSMIVRNLATGGMITPGAVYYRSHTRMKLDATNKIINITIPRDGTEIPANSVISLLLAIGSY